MFGLIKFGIKTIVMLKLMALAFAAGMGVAFAVQMRAQYQTWGLVEGGDERGMPGDELVSEADIVETRVVDIDAAPDRVWPWLVQLGYGRGGWYSYAPLDRPWSPSGGAVGSSADTILEEFQELAEGDVVPTHREGGFIVREIEPGSSLVLYLDDALVREQLEELVADAPEETVEAVDEMDMPPFAVSWAFSLEDAPGGRARLIERMRGHVEVKDQQRRAAPFMGFGVFMLMRSQMLGIKHRAETLAAAGEATGVKAAEAAGEPVEA